MKPKPLLIRPNSASPLRRFLFRLILMIAVTTSTMSGAAWAADPEAPSPEYVRRQVSEAVEYYTTKRKGGVDPRLTNQLANNVMIFTGNFCLQPASTECTDNFRDSSAFSGIVTDYLDALAEHLPTETQSLADRLAEGNLGKAGWPSTIGLEIGMLEVPDRYRNTRSYLRTATGLLPLGSDATFVLMTEGRATIEFETSEGRRPFTVTIAPGGRHVLDDAESDGDGDDSGDLLPPDEAFCYSDAPLADLVQPLWMFNWGRETFAEAPAVREKNLAPFTRQPVVAITAEIAPTFRCDDDCQADFGALFAQAIAVWRSGCTRCDANALALVRFGKSVWLDWRLSRRLGETRAGKTIDLDLATVEPVEVQRLRISPAWFGQSQVVPYTELSRDDPARRQICALSNDTAGWVKSARDHLCDAGIGFPGELRPRILFNDEVTSCGPMALACGLTYGNVEINGAEYAFTVNSGASQRQYRIGNPGAFLAWDLWPVILHEVGHWFGVPHSDIAGDQAANDIMAAGYGAGLPCVSSQSLTMLNNAADMRWEFRTASGGSLLPPP